MLFFHTLLRLALSVMCLACHILHLACDGQVKSSVEGSLPMEEGEQCTRNVGGCTIECCDCVSVALCVQALRLEQLSQEKGEADREFEEIKKQLEEDADREIEEMKEKWVGAGSWVVLTP